MNNSLEIINRIYSEHDWKYSKEKSVFGFFVGMNEPAKFYICKKCSQNVYIQCGIIVPVNGRIISCDEYIMEEALE